MAIKNRRHEPRGVVDADHGSEFTFWAFTNKIRSSGLMLYFGTVGDSLDNAMMESFWSSMQIEILNRKKWKTRILWRTRCSNTWRFSTTANGRHSGPDYRTPIEYERTYENQTMPA